MSVKCQSETTYTKPAFGGKIMLVCILSKLLLDRWYRAFETITPTLRWSKRFKVIFAKNPTWCLQCLQMVLNYSAVFSDIIKWNAAFDFFSGMLKAQEGCGTLIGEYRLVEQVEWYQIHQTHGFHLECSLYPSDWLAVGKGEDGSHSEVGQVARISVCLINQTIKWSNSSQVPFLWSESKRSYRPIGLSDGNTWLTDCLKLDTTLVWHKWCIAYKQCISQHSSQQQKNITWQWPP